MKNNLQYKRTDRDITDAFLKLLQKKPFEKIIVKNIMEEAMVNRSTFYQHFRDKYEIAEKLQTYYVEELKRTLEAINKKSPTKFGDVSELTRSYFIENRATLKLLMKIKVENVDIVNEWNKFFQEIYLSKVNSPYAEIEATLCSSVTLSFMVYYIEHDNINVDYSKMFLEVFMNAAMKLINLEDDKDAKDILLQRLTQSYTKRFQGSQPDVII